MKSQEEIQKLHDLILAILDNKDFQDKVGHRNLMGTMAISALAQNMPILCWVI
jgi:hypothetical protein